MKLGGLTSVSFVQTKTIGRDTQNTMETTETKPREVEFTRVKSDINGNPRYVCHFLSLLNSSDEIKADHNLGDRFGIDTKYNLALNKARSIGGRKYHNKSYGGGIVFQTYGGAEIMEHIRKFQTVNTNFIQNWEPKDFKRVEKAIFNHFRDYSYTYIDDHSKPAKPLTVGKHPECKFQNFAELDNLLGTAYTSSGDYAGYWICNGVYVMATEKHHFIGFAINTDGQVIGIADDENENSIFIEL